MEQGKQHEPLVDAVHEKPCNKQIASVPESYNGCVIAKQYTRKNEARLWLDQFPRTKTRLRKEPDPNGWESEPHLPEPNKYLNRATTSEEGVRILEWPLMAL